MASITTSACKTLLPQSLVKRNARRRGGFTLLEVMIATAVTLLMMVALAQIFKVIGDSMKQGRAVLELNNRLRSVVYRIRSDLDNLTAIPEPPADPATATGYLQIFDGSLTDYSTAQFSLAHSRFGDVDDILMATVRAGDVWFTGKVPAYILAQREPNPNVLTDYNLVSIASQHAEVVFYLLPEVSNAGNESRDLNHYLTSSPLGALAFQDTDGFPSFPDSFRMYYRVLLIRPDLNLPAPLQLQAFGGSVVPAGALPAGNPPNITPPNNSPWTIAFPLPGLPTPLCDMATAHQQCDLSIRRILGGGGTDFIAANSLEDLVDPANRFAHVRLPVPNTNSTTMPLLALGPSLTITSPFPASHQFVALNDPTGTLLPNNNSPFRVGSGFLHPAFALRGDRAGEDVIASNILSFDIKVFDPGVPLLPSLGGDNRPGVANTDDDGLNGTDDPGEFGWAGSDDLVLTPNDPGYALSLGATPVGTGEYVDLSWARKVVSPLLFANNSIPANANLWSEFSGFSASRFAANGVTRAFTDSLYNSGYVSSFGNATSILQPCYDTWTSRYEGDGVRQAEIGAREGVVTVGTSDVGSIVPAWRQSNVDAATDGIDNNAPPIDARGLGVDDVTEKETSPPYPTPLRGLKISVRMEDPLSRQVKQMSAAKEFVSQ